MGTFVEFPMLTIFMIVVLVWLLSSLLLPKKPQAASGQGDGRRVCRVCGAEHPPYAAFCGKCGNGL